MEIAALTTKLNLSENEVQIFHHLFEKGAGKDGKMTMEEFRDYFAKLRRERGINDEVISDFVFDAFDANHDDLEIFSNLSAISENSMFKLNTSDDGCISSDELEAYLKKSVIMRIGKEKAVELDMHATAQEIFERFALKRTFSSRCKKEKDIDEIIGNAK
ncbi:unnamed protein product [Adineta ricciae]|uniref:Uncharacterized protein n=1 Tax=Adineta ricciae TaxID=249248 RepID=A0A815FYQ4_ADIRI|nr:unnamed protein product [Adineta ricciae]